MPLERRTFFVPETQMKTAQANPEPEPLAYPPPPDITIVSQSADGEVIEYSDGSFAFGGEMLVELQRIATTRGTDLLGALKSMFDRDLEQLLAEEASR